MDFKNKKILLIGLGILGGGVSVANWLIGEGAILTIFDAKKKEELEKSVRQIRGKAKFFFEHCPEEEVRSADFVVLNQAVPMTNREALLAEKLGKPVLNESNIFYEMCEKPVIAITGTRGKTTTANWTAHLLGKGALVAGNSEKEPFLKVLGKANGKACKVVVNEIPSFQLERFRHAPEVAVITNIFNDHLNRHGTMENYARVKAAIFRHQGTAGKLVLNADNDWTEFFLSEKPKGQVWFFSLEKLPQGRRGVYFSGGSVFLRTDADERKILDVKKFIGVWGMHNLANLEAALLAGYLAGGNFAEMKKRIADLPQIKFRQELVFSSKKLDIRNDTAATSPEGGIAAIRRFGSAKCLLIAGGTDAGLDYTEWAETLAKTIPEKNVILLSGSATEKMLGALAGKADVSQIAIFDTLLECVEEALARAGKVKGKAVLLFSPAAKSFEKFKNEFDRGEKFNAIVSQLTRRMRHGKS